MKRQLDLRDVPDEHRHASASFPQSRARDGKPGDRREFQTSHYERGHNLPNWGVTTLMNVGLWVFHCHVLDHAEGCMMGDLMVMR